MTERAKLDRLDRYLSENDLRSVWFATPHLFAWITGGRNLVAREGAAGVAAAGYDGDEVTVLTDNIEHQRLLDEEVDDDVAVEHAPWYEGGYHELLGDRAARPAAADFDVPDFERVDRSAITQPLTDGDVERYRELSRETAAVVEAVAAEAGPEDTERGLAAELHRGLQARGIESTVVLVGGEERIQQYRHFTPQPVEVGGYVALTVVGVRDGLNAAVTRTVAFDDAPDWLDDRYDDVCRVAATAVEATQEVGRSGGTAGDVFERIQSAYDELGYEDEWENHHQGGALGTAGREWVGTPGGEEPIELPMTFAWNPTVVGAKTEETVLVTEDDVEVLSDTGEYPTRTAQSLDGDLELEFADLSYR